MSTLKDTAPNHEGYCIRKNLAPETGVLTKQRLVKNKYIDLYHDAASLIIKFTSSKFTNYVGGPKKNKGEKKNTRIKQKGQKKMQAINLQ